MAPLRSMTAAVAAASLLAGCGGGGGENPARVEQSTITMLAGMADSSQVGDIDANGSSARFDFPSQVAVDRTGVLFVAESSNLAVRKVSPTGNVTTLIRGSTFGLPSGVALARDGDAIVAVLPACLRCATFANLVRVDAAGTVTSIPTRSSGAPFAFASGAVTLAVDAAGNIYGADRFAHTIRRVSADGDLADLAGQNVPGFADGSGPAARFREPAGVAVDALGNVYVSDSGNHAIRKIASGGAVTTIAGSGASGHVDGAGTEARLVSPAGISVDDAGNIYVADVGDNTIRKIDASGFVSTIAGVAGQRGFTQGPLPGMLDQPLGVAVFGSDLYITMPAGIAVVRPRP